MANATYYVDKRVGDDSRTFTEAKNPLTPWKTLINPCNSSNMLANPDTNTIEIVEGSGPYFTTDCGFLSQDHLYTNHNNVLCTWNWNGNALQLDIDVNAGGYSWVRSTGVGKEDLFYLQALGGGRPMVDEYDGSSVVVPAVRSCIVNGVWSAESSNISGILPLVSRWAGNNWDWGDFDSLGYDTLYVRYSSGEDPTGGSQIWMPTTSQEVVIGGGFATTTHTHNDGTFRGSNSAIDQADNNAIYNRCKFINTNNYSIRAVNSRDVESYYCKFVDAGHSGLQIEAGVSGTFKLINGHYKNTHLMFKLFSAEVGVVLDFKNNCTLDMFAGGFQWDTVGPTVSHSNNQYHIDPDSVHGSEAIAFTTGTRSILTTGTTDLPPSTATSVRAEIDPVVDGDGVPQAGSPLIYAGEIVSGVHNQTNVIDLSGREFSPYEWSSNDAAGVALQDKSLSVGVGDKCSVDTPIVLTSDPSNGTIELVVNPAATGQSARVISIWSSADDYIAIVGAATVLAIYKQIGGVLVFKTFNYTTTAGTPFRVQVYWDGIAGVGIRAADASADISVVPFGVDTNTDTPLVDPTMHIGHIHDGSSLFQGEYHDNGVPVCFTSKATAGWV